MAEFKNAFFEPNEIAYCKNKVEAVNVGPYSISKLVIAEEATNNNNNQSYWSCSSSQSGSTEAEDDSRIEKERNRESLRSFDEARHHIYNKGDSYGDYLNEKKRLEAVNGNNMFGYNGNVSIDQRVGIQPNFYGAPDNKVLERSYPAIPNNNRMNNYEMNHINNSAPYIAQHGQYNNGPISNNHLQATNHHYPVPDVRTQMRVQPSVHQNKFVLSTGYQSYPARPLEATAGNCYRPPVSPLSSTYQNVAQHGVNSLNGMIYQVQFKCTFRHFILGAQQAQTVIATGDFVIVEADRGEDIGIVTDILTMKTFVERRIYMKTSVEDDNVIGRIVRVASVAERQFLPEKFHDEDNILQFCRELSHSTYRLPMVIHDVEYQFDRHKLTVYYAADSRVDFREFVRDLFSAYKARIWMKKLNTQRPIKIENWATVALATGMQFSPDSK